MGLKEWKAPIIGILGLAATQAIPVVRDAERSVVGVVAVELSTRYHEMFLMAGSAQHFAEAAQAMEVDDAERYLEKYSDTPFAQIFLARAYAKAGKHEKSAELYRAIIAEYEANPDNEKLWSSAKVAYEELQANHGYSTRDNNAESLTRKIKQKEAQGAMERKDYTQAISLYQAMDDQAKAEEATHLQEREALRQAATTADNEGRYEDAYHDYTQLGELFKEQANKAAENVGKKAIKMGDERGAREWLRKAGYEEVKMADMIQRQKASEVWQKKSAQARERQEKEEAQEKMEMALAAGIEAFSQADYRTALQQWTLAENQEGVASAHRALADQLFGENKFSEATWHYLAAGDKSKARDAFEKATEKAFNEGYLESAAYYYEQSGNIQRHNKTLSTAAKKAMEEHDFETATRCYIKSGMPPAKVKEMVNQGKQVLAKRLQQEVFSGIAGLYALNSDSRLEGAVEKLERLIQLKTELDDVHGVEQLWYEIAKIQKARGETYWAAEAFEKAGENEKAAKLHWQRAEEGMASSEDSSQRKEALWCETAFGELQDAEQLYPTLTATTWGAEFEAFENRTALCAVREGFNGRWSYYNATDRALEILTVSGLSQQDAYKSMAVLREDLGHYWNAAEYYEKAEDHDNAAQSWLRVYRTRAMDCISDTGKDRPGIGECLSGGSRNSELFEKIAEQLSAGN